MKKKKLFQLKSFLIRDGINLMQIGIQWFKLFVCVCVCILLKTNTIHLKTKMLVSVLAWWSSSETYSCEFGDFYWVFFFG